MIIADTNEFHPLVDGVKYKTSRESDGTNHPIVIMRATYSTTHVDNAYVASLAQARKAGLYVGHYGYMTATVDAAAQGVFFANIVKSHGGLKLGDTIWCDDEEGSGNQAARAEAFLNAAHAVLHDDTRDEGVYSGASFWKSFLGGVGVGRLRWVAAYGQGDPKLPGEDLWQFTDNRTVPGVSGNCDASIYLGNVSEFIAMVAPAAPATPQPVRHVVAAGNTLTIGQLAQRRNSTVGHIRAVSAAHLSAPHLAVLDAFIALEQAMSVSTMPAPPMPEGLIYWTAN